MTPRTDEDYDRLAADERKRRIKRAAETAIEHGYREKGKLRTQARRFARRTKRVERDA